MRKLVLFLTIGLFLSGSHAPAAPSPTAFSYQGFLAEDGTATSGVYDLHFELLGPGQVPGQGRVVTALQVPVAKGLFTVELDFGMGVFNGSPHALRVSVRERSTDPFIALDPPQPLTPTPEAFHAATVSRVPDSALSENVALLDGSPTFVGGISVSTIQVVNPDGAGLMKFGPGDDCSLGVDPAGPAGLLLRDPRGVRVLNPDGGPARLLFGPTDDCTIGIDPAVGGMLLRDPRGIRLLSPNANMPPILRFGPTDDCSLGIDPAFPGLIERDPVGFRLMGRDNQGCRLIFGPTMDCTVEIDPLGPAGLLLRDPRGIRILPRDPAQPKRILFGPTDDCSIGIDAAVGGLLLRDPRGIRLLSPNPNMPPILRFGPTDDCSLGIDPAFPGLIERDPVGFRLMGRNNQGCRLIFGPTMDCTIEVDPQGPAGLLLRDPRGIRILPRDPAEPQRILFGPTDDCSIGVDAAVSGLLLRDPRGIRLVSPSENMPPILRFGPTDDCSLGIDPAFPGLIERDPVGFRLMGRNNQGCRLIFGPTMDCTIEVNPQGPAGLLLRDPNGIRLLTPDPRQPVALRFGPTDDCSISVFGAPGTTPGMRFSDPGGFRFNGPVMVNGPVTASEFIQSSTRRLKENIEPLDEPLEKIQKLRGVRFNWKENAKADIGFIAEEVGGVIPEVVAWEEDGQNAKGINYGHLVAVAIEGIKAQQAQIKSLEEEKTELREQLRAMRGQIDQLAQQLQALNAP